MADDIFGYKPPERVVSITEHPKFSSTILKHSDHIYELMQTGKEQELARYLKLVVPGQLYGQIETYLQENYGIKFDGS